MENEEKSPSPKRTRRSESSSSSILDIEAPTSRQTSPIMQSPPPQDSPNPDYAMLAVQQITVQVEEMKEEARTLMQQSETSMRLVQQTLLRIESLITDQGNTVQEAVNAILNSIEEIQTMLLTKNDPTTDPSTSKDAE